MTTWYAKSIQVIVVKNSRKGPVGPYNIYEFFLSNGQKIGELSESEIKNNDNYPQRAV